MGLYRLFSYNVEIQYKSYFLSKAMLFTFITTVLNIGLPFLIAYRSRGFWLNSHYFYEKPVIRPTFDYLLIAETSDPSVTLTCGDTHIVNYENKDFEEHCAEVQIQEHDYNKDNRNDMLNFRLNINVPNMHTISSIILILGLDFHLMSVCLLQMQSLAVITRDFAVPSSGLKFHGHLKFDQTSHLPCLRHHIDTTNNISLFNIPKYTENNVDFMMENYLSRETTTLVKPIYVRNQIGSTGTFLIDVHLKIPEMKILYTPSILQEIKWAWPQYLSMVVVFYWIFSKIKRFVFNNRLLMAWEIIPWKKPQ
ncbi:transmembrane protein 231 isoform X1 [Colias croceus]|uniref:transmembrane protein 231 isoform X1 n=1 Tax=Colias crocea TaxID=72248 RepID=UPI001E27D5BC|nr:transmembrane protein 231 isoform X1 [Colias croceus]